MLSYRHAFHAGNHADVLKHWVQVMILDSLKKKEKPFLYVDTHSGVGMYSLKSDVANKTAEYKDGIAKLLKADDCPEEIQPYLALLDLNKGQVKTYPGSPEIARRMMREKDKAVLCELHPQDHASLSTLMGADKRVRVLKENGYGQLKAILPHQIKRGLVIIDPSYEIKDDYLEVSKAVSAGIKRCATMTYAVWYPIVNYKYVERLVKGFQDENITNILRIELNVDEESDALGKQGKGMMGSGMLVINAPWQLDEKARIVLPWMVDVLSTGKGGYKVDIVE